MNETKETLKEEIKNLKISKREDLNKLRKELRFKEQHIKRLQKQLLKTIEEDIKTHNKSVSDAENSIYDQYYNRRC